jgi:glycolate oxidase
LGIFTQITLRVIPRPTHYATARISFNSLEEATKAVSRVIAMGISPAVLELLDTYCLATIKKFSKQAFPDVKAMLLIEVDGFSEDISEGLHKAVEICWEENAIDVRESKSEEEREKLWEARKATLPSLARYKPTLILEDVTVPVSNLSILMRKIEAIAKRHGVEIATFGHAGDGNLHPTFLVDRRNKEEIEKTEEAVKELFEETIKLGGTLTGEHGIGIEKKGFIHLEHSDSLELMRGIKIAVDPKNIMNPGKIFEV